MSDTGRAVGAVIPWQAAFVAFCNGAPEDEIAQIFSIPADTLAERMRKENWRKLREDVQVNAIAQARNTLPDRIEAKLKLIQANREENLKVFATLREHLIESVRALAERRLKLQKHWKGKFDQVITAEVDPGPGDWVNIATYARTIAEGTYRALGDFQAQEKPGSDAPAGAQAPSAPAITIILPGAIAQPRSERRLEDGKAGQVIDLTPLATETPAN